MTARRRNTLSRCAAALVASLVIGTGPIVNRASAEILLAEYDVFSATGSWSSIMFDVNYIVAETFVPTITGTAFAIDVAVSKDVTTTIPMSWTIRSTYMSEWNGIQPDFSPAGALATGSLAAADCPDVAGGCKDWTRVVMTPAELQTEQTYALVATANTDEIYRWWTRTSGTGGNGTHLVGWYSDPQGALGSGTGDAGFRIIAVPEPSCVPLLLLGALAGCAGVVRRRA